MKHVFCVLTLLGLAMGMAEADYSITTIDPPGTATFGINDAGQIVGNLPYPRLPPKRG